MKLNKSNFSKFYLEKLNSKLILIEEMRKESLKHFFSISIVYDLIILGLMIKNLNNLFFIFLLISLLTAGNVAIFFFVFKNYRKTFKQRIISILFQEIFDEHIYDHNRRLTENDFNSSFLYRKNYNRFNGEDLIEGTFKGQDIKLSELHVQHVRNGKKKKVKTIFKGLLIILKVKTPFNSISIVEPDNIIQSISIFEDHYSNPIELESVHLESIDFEKLFSVSSTDQVECRKILTPSTQENLTEIKNKFKLTFSFSIQPNQVSIAIPSNKNLFEPTYFTPCNKVGAIQEITEIFIFLEELLKEVKVQ